MAKRRQQMVVDREGRPVHGRWKCLKVGGANGRGARAYKGGLEVKHGV